MRDIAASREVAGLAWKQDEADDPAPAAGTTTRGPTAVTALNLPGLSDWGARFTGSGADPPASWL